ncbi:hypothetical protein VPFG_00154 [Vibrio phage nt-1]|uniref:Uncharacterized protein n=1 Tax=Vibrio phage nt-1 TaxID=115992 RepID=R9TEH5_9CAUD|nr:hypothetical protein VPFG_00154 [Vibrio phage nt-1]AGN30156.1 hypothetical protein VPFG_00154 [Vibrio phage nt-1]
MKNVILLDHDTPRKAVIVRTRDPETDLYIDRFRDVGIKRIYSANMIAVEDLDGKYILVKNRYTCGAHDDKIRFSTIDGMIAYMNSFLIDCALPTINSVFDENAQAYATGIRGI